MVGKNYEWKDGAELGDHSKKKHAILREYFRQYLITRCKIPQQEKFRLAVIDGFSGSGLYKCGSYGSPIIIIDVLIKTTHEINVDRVNQGVRPIKIECLLILNDLNESAIKLLGQNIVPFLLETKQPDQQVFIEPLLLNAPFEKIYPQIKQKLLDAKCRNVLFNLDQCGYSHVNSSLIRDIINSWRSAEILLTFMIESMLTYLSPSAESNAVPLEPDMKQKVEELRGGGNKVLGKNEWLGMAEKVVFEHLKDCAPFVSPFSINNPNGWRYWLMHFANSYRARQVYNDILHQDGTAQAHFGRAGLNMLSYDPQYEGQLYLFNSDSREAAKEELYRDIPNFIAESGDTLGMEDFYKAAYSDTPAHSDDIHDTIIENPDIEVITESGGERRKSNTIKPRDTLKLKNQKSMFFMFPGVSPEK